MTVCLSVCLSVCPSVHSFLSLHGNYAEITSLTKKDKNNKQKYFYKFMKSDVELMIYGDVGEKKGMETR